MSRTSSVSIVVLYHCAHDPLDRALRSVESQLYPAHEVIVVDCSGQAAPGSPWEQWNNRFNGNLRHLQISSLSDGAARNVGAACVTGEIVTFLDARDEMLPLAVDNYTRLFRRAPTTNVCFGRSVIRRDDDTLVPSNDGRQPEGNVVKALLKRELIIQSSSFACRRSLLNDELFPQSSHGLESLDLLIRLAQVHRFRSVQEDVAIVSEQVCRMTPRRASSLCEILKRQMERYGCASDASEMNAALAQCEFDAALRWRRAGDLRRSYQHALAASKLQPRKTRYWMTAAWLRSQLAIAKSQEQPDAA